MMTNDGIHQSIAWRKIVGDKDDDDDDDEKNNNFTREITTIGMIEWKIYMQRL